MYYKNYYLLCSAALATLYVGRLRPVQDQKF